MFRERSEIPVLFLIAVMVAAIGCRKDTGPYEIGVVLPLSGEARRHSMDVMKGIEIGFEEINTIKGVRGKELKAVYLDANRDDEELRQKFMYLISQQGIVIYVILESKAAALIGSLSRNEDIIVFTDWQCAGEDAYGVRYAITPRPYTEGKLLARLAIKELKSARAFLLKVHPDKKLSRFEEGFLQGYEVEGGRTLNIMQYREEMKEAHPLELISKFNVDLAVIATSDEPSPLVGGMRNAGFTGNIVISHTSGNLMQAAAELDTFGKVFYPVPAFSCDSEERIVREFQERYRRKFNRDANYTASVYYDLAEIIAYVLEINGDDAGRIHGFLGKLRDYNAITGRTSYYPDGEVEKPMRLREIR